MITKNKIEFKGLQEAFNFLIAHGGVERDLNVYNNSEFPYEIILPPHGAFGPAASYVLLKDGSIFGVEAYTNGPLSDVTPDEDFGVNLVGWTNQ